MRIDAHQHFWQYDPHEYAWMTEAMGILRQDYLPPDLKPLLDRTGIDGTIAVQARQSLGETDWLLDLADRYDFIQGVVGWVDLQSPQVRNQLAHYARHPKFCGVRHIVHDEPDDQFLLLPDVLRGLRLLSEFDVAYDLLLFPRHLPVAIKVVEQFPDQRFVLDHIAKPPIKAQTFSPWVADLQKLASFNNVYCKISGLVTEADWHQWPIGDFTRFLDTVFDCFGAERLLFGSDWPVCTLAAQYAEVVLIIQDYIRGLSIETQDRIIGRNAVHVYRLDDR